MQFCLRKKNYLNSISYCKSDGKKFDVLKIVLAIFIVAIHTTPVTFPLRPLFRLAVPVFFILSSYLFFSKQARLLSEEEKSYALRRFINRYLKLYFFWFLLLLPVTVIVRKWYVSPGLDTILSIFQCFLFGSTFRASWFLMAALIAIVFVWYFSKWINDKWMIVLGCVFYLFCCLTSNYFYLCSNIIDVYEKYESVFKEPYNSFPVAFLFVMFGKILAERAIFIPQYLLFVLTIASLIFFYGEYCLIQEYSLSIEDDSYLLLAPLSLFVFMFIGQSKWTLNKDTKGIRKASTIIYCCHASYASIVNFILEQCGMESLFLFYTTLFVITLMLSYITVYIISRLETYSHFRLLKYAY